MKSSRPIQSLLILWALWEFINAALSTFAGPLGATFVAWVPRGGWTGDLYAMSQQYGMVLFVLGAVYLLIASDPVRYRAFVWIPIVEQIIGIGYATYGLVGAHTMTGQQLATQVAINLVIAVLFYLLATGADLGGGRSITGERFWIQRCRLRGLGRRGCVSRLARTGFTRRIGKRVFS